METNQRLKTKIVEVVTNQIEQNDPMCTKENYERLMKSGYSQQKAKEMIGAVLIEEMYSVMKEQKPFNEEQYSKKLAKLQ